MCQLLLVRGQYQTNSENLFSGPTDIEGRSSERVERFMKFGQTALLPISSFQSGPWTQAPVNRDTLAIQTIDQCDYILL